MAPTGRRNALVTMLVGESYVQEWETYCRDGWLDYGKRHDCDVIVLTQPILPDAVTAERSLHWQKLLVPSLPGLRDYDSVAWVDGDILINAHRAPSIFAAHDLERIAVVNQAPVIDDRLDVMTTGERWTYLAKLAVRPAAGQPVPRIAEHIRVPTRLYAADRLEPAPKDFVNTGVFVFNPARHGAFFTKVFQKYRRDSRNGDYEQTPLSFEILQSGLAEFIDPRFNRIWSLEAARHYPFLFHARYVKPAPEDRAAWVAMARQCVNAAFFNSYFLHFAGGAGSAWIKSAMRLVEAKAEHIFQVMYPEHFGPP